MKTIKGILFDKDGTLLDFNSIWVPVAEALAEEFVKDFNLENVEGIREELLSSIGVNSEKVDPHGVLAWGTASDVANELKKVLVNKKIDVDLLLDIESLVEGKINRLAGEKRNLMKPIGNLEKLFSELKNRGIYIGLATSDTYESAKICLQTLKIEQYFDFIGADDGVSIPKPDPYLLNRFCEICGIKPEETAVAGDTKVDINFAKNGNAALAIGVLSGTNSAETLSKGADLILNSVNEILEIDGSFAWCK